MLHIHTYIVFRRRLDRVYYGNRLDDTRDILDLRPLFKDVATPVDQRSTPGEQVKSKSKDAYDIITKWANNPNLKDHLLAKFKGQ